MASAGVPAVKQHTCGWKGHITHISHGSIHNTRYIQVGWSCLLPIYVKKNIRFGLANLLKTLRPFVRIKQTGNSWKQEN